jgi:two-component SAPR family response regulator
MRKAEELVALLVCEKGGRISKPKAAEALWPDAEPEQAADSLRKATSYLRKEIADGNLPLKLLMDKNTLQLDVSGIAADIFLFPELCKSDDADDWEKAVDMYRGQLLADTNYGWAVEYEGKYDMAYYDLLEKLAVHYDSAGNRDKAGYFRDKLSE